jgi:hypothetical protein
LWVAARERRHINAGALDHIGTTAKRGIMRSLSKRARVTALMNAISDLNEGDLLTVLKLNQSTPLIDFAPNDKFRLREDGTVEHVRGFPPPSKGLKHRIRTGNQLGRVLEHHLMAILVFGEIALRNIKKEPRAKREIGGRHFV